MASMYTPLVMIILAFTIQGTSLSKLKSLQPPSMKGPDKGIYQPFERTNSILGYSATKKANARSKDTQSDLILSNAVEPLFSDLERAKVSQVLLPIGIIRNQSATTPSDIGGSLFESAAPSVNSTLAPPPPDHQPEDATPPESKSEGEARLLKSYTDPFFGGGGLEKDKSQRFDHSYRFGIRPFL